MTLELQPGASASLTMPSPTQASTISTSIMFIAYGCPVTTILSLWAHILVPTLHWVTSSSLNKDFVILGVIPDPKHHNESLFTSHLPTLGIPPGPKRHNESLIWPLIIIHINGLLVLHNKDYYPMVFARTSTHAQLIHSQFGSL